jgi:hypothetical protein
MLGRATTPKLKIPNNAEVLPWSVVFLVLFISLGCVSSVMSMVDSWRSAPPTQPPQPILEDIDDVTTAAPLIPQTRKRRYDVSSDPRTAVPYLFSNSMSTRYETVPPQE